MDAEKRKNVQSASRVFAVFQGVYNSCFRLARPTISYSWLLFCFLSHPHLDCSALTLSIPFVWVNSHYWRDCVETVLLVYSQPDCEMHGLNAPLWCFYSLYPVWGWECQKLLAVLSSFYIFLCHESKSKYTVIGLQRRAFATLLQRLTDIL